MSPRVIRQKLNYAKLPAPREFEWSVFRANPLTIQLGVFRGSAVDDLADVVSISVTGRSSLSSDDDLFKHTVLAASFGDPTSGTWTDGSAQHATFNLTGGNTNRAPVDLHFVAIHIVITALMDDDSEITLGIGRLLIHEDNNGEDYPAEENATVRKYVFGELSASGASLKIYDRDMVYQGWVQIMSGDAP